MTRASRATCVDRGYTPVHVHARAQSVNKTKTIAHKNEQPTHQHTATRSCYEDEDNCQLRGEQRNVLLHLPLQLLHEGLKAHHRCTQHRFALRPLFALRRVGCLGRQQRRIRARQFFAGLIVQQVQLVSACLSSSSSSPPPKHTIRESKHGHQDQNTP